MQLSTTNDLAAANRRNLSGRRTISPFRFKTAVTELATLSPLYQKVDVFLGGVFAKVVVRNNLRKDVLERSNRLAAERQKTIIVDLIDICPAARIDTDMQRRRSLLAKPHIAAAMFESMNESSI